MKEKKLKPIPEGARRGAQSLQLRILPQTRPLLTTMSEKPKVYQGVRVKITVKELLQQKRANQAASGGTLSGGSSVHLPDPVTPPSAVCCEPESISSTPNYFQPQEFSNCLSCEENPSYLDQLLDSYLQTETRPDPLLNPMQSASHCFPDSFQATPFYFNQSLTPGSSSDASSLSGSLDFSYSPAHLPPYAPENYNPAPSLDTGSCGYPSGDYAYQPLPSQAQYDCFLPTPTSTSGCSCVSCEAERLAALGGPECFSSPGADYLSLDPSAAAASDFYVQEAGCDVCYSSECHGSGTCHAHVCFSAPPGDNLK